MPKFDVWTTLYSVIFAVFAVGWGFWLGIIAIVVNLINLLIFSSDMFNIAKINAMSPKINAMRPNIKFIFFSDL
jgi:membrane protein insertase Oxa1/YidC/SpoIIIJ